MKFKNIILFSVIIFTLFIIAQPIFARDQGIFSDIPCFKTGDAFKECDLCDFLYLFLILAHWGLNIMGAIALLFFVIGGIVWLTSAGNQNQITAGKKILTGTIMGIIIILSAYIIVNFTVSALTEKNKGKIYFNKQQLKEWYGICDIEINK